MNALDAGDLYTRKNGEGRPRGVCRLSDRLIVAKRLMVGNGYKVEPGDASFLHDLGGVVPLSMYMKIDLEPPITNWVGLKKALGDFEYCLSEGRSPFHKTLNILPLVLPDRQAQVVGTPVSARDPRGGLVPLVNGIVIDAGGPAEMGCLMADRIRTGDVRLGKLAR